MLIFLVLPVTLCLEVMLGTLEVIAYMVLFILSANTSRYLRCGLCTMMRKRKQRSRARPRSYSWDARGVLESSSAYIPIT